LLAGTLSSKEATAGGRVDPEALGVAFVNFFPGLVRLLFGEVPAGKMRLKPRQIGVPAGCGLRCARAVVEEVGKDQPTAAFVSGQLEAVAIAAEGPGQTMGCIDLSHLAGRAVGLEGLTRLRCPVGRGGKLPLKLCGVCDCSPHALDGVGERAIEAQRWATVDGLQGSVGHGFSSRCRSRASRRSDQNAR
jgi:hypothetical protein